MGWIYLFSIMKCSYMHEKQVQNFNVGSVPRKVLKADLISIDNYNRTFSQKEVVGGKCQATRALPPPPPHHKHFYHGIMPQHPLCHRSLYRKLEGVSTNQSPEPTPSATYVLQNL